MAIRFFRCRHCGNLVEKSIDSGVPLVCCGEEMEELTANVNETGSEKHLPVVTFIDDDSRLHVKVGSTAHPMLPEHHICFVALETEHGIQRINLTDKPEAVFCLSGEIPIAVYEYCNIHGLWKTVVSF